MNHKTMQKVIGALVFIIAFLVFYSTMAPTVSFWDCGEYIASCYSLGIPHPPGNPFFILLGRIFTMILNTEQVAARVNLISVISGAFSALFLYLIVVRAVIGAVGELDTTGKKITAYVGGVVGALFGVFNYTFWFSAIESSVYIPSILTIIINLYIALVWAQSKDENRDRLLLLFSYLAFLGVGIHMMALFALIPIFVFVVMVDRDKFVDWQFWLIAFIMGSVAYDVGGFIKIAPVLLIITALRGYAPTAPAFFVNIILTLIVVGIKLGGDYTNYEEYMGNEENSFFGYVASVAMGYLPFLALVGFVVGDISKLSIDPGVNYKAKFSFYVVLFSLMGYSVHAYIPIRSALEPMIDENHPVVKLKNGGKADKAYEAFFKALEEEAPIKENYLSFMEEVQKKQEIAQLKIQLDQAIEYDGNPQVEYAKFEALLKDSSYTSVQALFNSYETIASMNQQLQIVYNNYVSLLRSEETIAVKEIKTARNAFIKLLMEDAYKGARKAYENFLIGVQKDKTLTEQYSTFQKALLTGNIVELNAAFTKAVEKDGTVKRAYSKFVKSLDDNSEISVAYSAYQEAVKSGNKAEALKTQDAFLDLVSGEMGAVEKAYSDLMKAVDADEVLKEKYTSFEDDIKLDFVSKKNHEAFVKAVEENSTVAPLYSAFLTSLDGNKKLKDAYTELKENLGKFKLTEFHWDAFKGFLERKQYGSESMISRAMHRRGAFDKQFGWDGHMGYLGFHLTQFYHFGESINDDRRSNGRDLDYQAGARERNNVLKTTGVCYFKGEFAEAPAEPMEEWAYFDTKEKAPFRYENGAWKQLGKRGIKYNFVGSRRYSPASHKKNDMFFSESEMTFKYSDGVNWNYISGTTMGGFLRLLIYLIPTFFVIWAIGYWYKLDLNSTVLFLLLVGSTTIGFIIYMNFADGSRTDSKMMEQYYQRQVDRYQEAIQQWPAYEKRYEEHRKEALAQGRQPQPKYEKPQKPEYSDYTVHREVRIRDYFYTAGFTFFGLWIGLAAAALLHLLFSSKREGLGKLVAALLLASTAIPVVANYEEHNRTHDWIPYDYAKNLLESCEPHAILFTNGDNDTFPLWFIQEAEGVRTDVRVVNFSLLNTKWYVRQLKRLEPKVPIPYTDYEIANMPDRVQNRYTEEGIVLKKTGLRVNPPTGGGLTIANRLVLEIVDENNWEKPVYFTINTPSSSLQGLDPYLEMQGMVQRVMKKRVPREKKMNIERTRYLLDSVYSYRGFSGENSVTLSETAYKTARNYASIFIRFADNLTNHNELSYLERRYQRNEEIIKEYPETQKRFSVEMDRLADDNSQQGLQAKLQLQMQMQQYKKELESIKAGQSELAKELNEKKEAYKQNVEDALKYIDKAIELSAEPHWYDVKAQFLEVAGRTEEAEAVKKEKERLKQ